MKIGLIYKTKLRALDRRWRKTRLARRALQLSARPGFAGRYLRTAIVLLTASTALWSYLGARLQESNADQLVNAYLFQGNSFGSAVLPDQHTFLIKWPLFYAAKLMGYSSFTFIVLTMAVSLATVGLLLFVLSRIERRPLVLGTICLMLASTLLLVPAQPYAGGILPVNMAMITTRNLEYIWYIGSLWFIARSTRVRNRHFVIGSLLLALLIASDKLFLSVSIAGATLALVAFALRQRWTMVSLAVRWLMASVLASIGALLLLAVLTHASAVRLLAQNAVGPYALIGSLKDTVLGVVYAVGGLFTNFGANPAYDTLTLKHIPAQAGHNLASIAGPAYVVNLFILLLALFAGVILLLRSLSLRRKRAPAVEDTATRLSVMLLWATVAVAGLFVATKHYYVVDARYLTLGFFGLFVGLATWWRSKREKPELLLPIAALVTISIICGAIAAHSINSGQQAALQPLQQRNSLVAKTLANHRVDVLVGDYWRVIPEKFVSGNRQTVLPLDDCTTPRSVLTSRAWQPDLKHHSFAYLLTLKGSLTNYPSCNLQEVIKTYGAPNSSALISGTLADPNELLLFYDRGSHPPSPDAAAVNTAPATVLPIGLDELPHTGCRVPTIMQVMAHEDDDLLFMNPDLIHDIHAGYCIRSVYLTAGDAGADSPYWLAREQGSEAAYSEMLDFHDVWVKRIVRLSNGQFVSIANPRGSDKVSLIFMHLPDGNLKGEGFGSYHGESLAKLESGSIATMTAVDRQSTYTSPQLIGGLVDLLHTYQPAEIRTQSNFPGSQFPDHSDHRTVGRLMLQAHQQYVSEQFGGLATVPIVFYMGYPVHELPPNVVGPELATKEAAFMAYSAYDGHVCQSRDQCRRNPAYGAYLPRQYRNPN